MAANIAAKAETTNPNCYNHVNAVVTFFNDAPFLLYTSTWDKIKTSTGTSTF